MTLLTLPLPHGQRPAKVDVVAMAPANAMSGDPGTAVARSGPTAASTATPAHLPSAAPDRTLWAATGFSAALLVGFTVAALLDTRTLAGADVWLKPAKFALSFVVLFATLAWVAERLSPAVRQGRLLRTTVAAMVLAAWGEMAYIAGRAGLGKASHFAVGTPLEGAMYTLMGIGAVTLVAGIAVIGWLVGRDQDARLSVPLRAGVRWGFALSAGLTLVTAGYLSSQGGHFVGTPSAGAATIPLLGWSGEVGDLRPAHFLALHAMQLLPAVGLWQARRGSESVAFVRVAAGLVTLATAALFIQALMGWPLVRL